MTVMAPPGMDFMTDALKGSEPVGGFPDSPLLTNPDQVKEILAGASTPLLAEHGVAAASSNSSGVVKTAQPRTPQSGDSRQR